MGKTVPSCGALTDGKDCSKLWSFDSYSKNKGGLTDDYINS